MLSIDIHLYLLYKFAYHIEVTILTTKKIIFDLCKNQDIHSIVFLKTKFIFLESLIKLGEGGQEGTCSLN